MRAIAACLAALLCVQSALVPCSHAADAPGVADAAATSAPTAVAVRTYRGVEMFEQVAVGAAASLAARVNLDRDGVGPATTPGYTVANRVTVQSYRGDAGELLSHISGVVEVTPIAAAPGFWSVQLTTVGEAIALADALFAEGRWELAYVDIGEPIVERTCVVGVPTDPRFSTNQWNLRNNQAPLFDANLEAAWCLGYTGAGVTIGISEPGRWQIDHIDLAANYHAAASQAIGALSSHATSVAGVAGMVGNNGIYGAGAAFNARLSVQAVAGTTQNQADAIGFRNDLNAIKNNSWGPSDDGLMRSLDPIVRTAIETAIATGRGGLGEIFVWAAGNGGAGNDRVDYDPYASNRHIIAVGAIGDSDTRSTYNEFGSSMTVVAQSDGNLRRVYSVGVNNSENTVFGGTSAASPLASGVVALLLEANPNLTWRDVQHILKRTARRNDPTNADWVQNGAGRWVNYSYGYGAIDAGAAVAAAQGWMNVPPETSFDSGIVPVNAALPDNDANGVEQAIVVGANLRVECVEIVLNATTTSIGNLQVEITSPLGTNSVLTLPRSFDTQDNFVNQLLTSRRHWDETSIGEWRVKISDRIAGVNATWSDVRLVIHGVEVCDGDADRDGDIDLTDLAILLTSFGLNRLDAGYSAYADFSGDGAVTLNDLAILLVHFGSGCP